MSESVRYTALPSNGSKPSPSPIFLHRNIRRLLIFFFAFLFLLTGYGVHLNREKLPAVQAVYNAGGKFVGGWLDLEDPRIDLIIRLRELRMELLERFDMHDKFEAREMNIQRIDALVECVAHNNCKPNQDKVVIMASHHFGLAVYGFMGGEDIWALAVDQTIESLGYTAFFAFGHMEALSIWLTIPELVERVIMEASDLEGCAHRTPAHQDIGRPEDYADWQHNRIGCIRRAGYEEGIPLWRIHSFHGWANPAHPLGANFTVSLEPFRELGIGRNYYLGYTIENRCMAIPVPEKKNHQALILGKNPSYLTVARNRFSGLLAPAAATIPHEKDEDGNDVPFQIVAVAGQKGEEVEEDGVLNKGMLPMPKWYNEVAHSKVLIGLGDPTQSPSPYDAMCLGVPFINPIVGFRKEDPENKEKWQLQQPALVNIPEPYVYHVHAHNATELEAAIAKAVNNPIERYIPPRMTLAAMEERVTTFLTFDWLEEAEGILASMDEEKRKEFPYLL